MLTLAHWVVSAFHLSRSMELPKNSFKTKLRGGDQQIGLWCTLPGSYVAELLAGAGFDWMLLDTEHSPGDPLTVYAQLQAIAAYGVSPVVRPAANDITLIKRFLDLGAQTLLIPYIQTAEEARQCVAATRYPPDGVRGVSAVTRATRFGRVKGYGKRAEEELCLLVQVETSEALDRVEEIAMVAGIDGVFIGPGDLAASLGYVGQPDHPDVKAAISDAISRIRACGKPVGILTSNSSYAKQCIDMGTTFTAVGVDASLLANATDLLRREFNS